MAQEPLEHAEEWAVKTFGAAELGDPRHTDRLIKVASALAANPSASLPHALETWGETQGAYRFLSDGAFSYEEILTPHWSQIYDEATQCPRTLLLADTTEFDFSTLPATQRLGSNWQQQGEYWLQFAHGAGDEPADAANLGVYHPGTLPTQTRSRWGNKGARQETGAGIAGLGAQCATDRTGT
jgi:hypothetical protein